MNRLLEQRNKRKKPKFMAQEVYRKKRLKKHWRRPRGIDSKIRLQWGGRMKMVKPGYGSPAAVKGLNRKGLLEVVVANVDDLKKIKEGMIGLISSSTGTRKKIEIINEAKKMNVNI